MAKKKKRGGGGGGFSRIGDPNSSLDWRGIKRLSKKLTKLEIRPQASIYDRLASQLANERDQVNTGLGRLGERATANVSGAYRTMAESAAQGIARQRALGNLLQQRSGEINQQAQQQLQSGQEGSLGSYMEGLSQRGAPGGGAAQAELQRVAQAEQSRQAQSGRAAADFANAQAGGYSGYATGQAGAVAQRGTESVADIQRAIANRIAESSLRYGQDIREARGKAADVRALKGPTRVKNLLDLRESERNFGLSQAAVGMDRAGLALDQAKLNEDRRQFNVEAGARARGQWTGSGGGGGGGSGDKYQPGVVSAAFQRVKAEMGGYWPGNRKEWDDFYARVMKEEGVEPKWAPRVRRQIKRKRRKLGG